MEKVQCKKEKSSKSLSKKVKANEAGYGLSLFKLAYTFYLSTSRFYVALHVRVYALNFFSSYTLLPL